MTHILLPAEDQQRLKLIEEGLGYTKGGLLKNIVQGFFKKHRDFYIRSAISDAEARGISPGAHYLILRDEDEETLPPHQKPFRLEASPLCEIPPIAQAEENQRGYNTLQLPALNYVLLRAAHAMHDISYPQLLGRMAQIHLNDYWETVYLPQLENDRADNYPGVK